MVRFSVVLWLLLLTRCCGRHTSAPTYSEELSRPDFACAPDVGCASEGKDPIHFADPAMAHFSHQRNRLQPAQAFLDPLPLLLADDVSHVPRGAAINRAPTFRPRFCATCGTTPKFRHSAKNPRVSNPISPPTVTDFVPSGPMNLPRRGVAPSEL